MTTYQQQMIEDMTVRGLAPATQQAYLRALTGLEAYYGRCPTTLSARQVQRYLLFLHEDRGLARSTCNTLVHGLRFSTAPPWAVRPCVLPSPWPRNRPSSRSS